MIVRLLTLLFAVGMLALVGMAATFYGEGRGIDWQRTQDQRAICRAYPQPDPITGLHCGPVIYSQP